MTTKIACSPLTGRIFQGRVNTKLNAFTGEKKDVTSDVLESVIAKAEFHGGTFEIEGVFNGVIVDADEYTPKNVLVELHPTKDLLVP
jgi:hypothetical protein